MKTIEFNQQKIKLVKSKKYKYLRLSISNFGTIRLSAPQTIAFNQIFNFLTENINWLEKNLERIDTSSGKSIFELTTITTCIGEFEVRKFAIPGRNPKVSLAAADKLAVIVYDPNMSKTKQESELQLALVARLKELARSIVVDELRKINQDTADRFSYKRISIREQKSRWGSCSSVGNLNFNWKIVLAPYSVFKYVLIHELAHLEQHNHSHNFWRIVTELHPSYREDRQWLKTNGSSLAI
jgi:predicted metal-dependent hydrolase